MKTLTGESIKVTPNYSKRTFTIRKDYAKYRTIQMSKDEFENCEFMTGQDWQHFLNSTDDYYKV